MNTINEAKNRWQMMSDEQRRAALRSYDKETARARAKTRWLSLATSDVAPGSEPRVRPAERQLGDHMGWAS